MAHEQDGLLIGLALPFQQKIAVDLDLFAGSKDLREQLPQQGVEAAEFLHLRLGTVRDGLYLHHAGELFSIFADSFFIRGGDITGLLMGHHQRTDDGQKQHGHQRRQQRLENVQNDHSFASLISFLKA